MDNQWRPLLHFRSIHSRRLDDTYWRYYQEAELEDTGYGISGRHLHDETRRVWYGTRGPMDGPARGHYVEYKKIHHGFKHLGKKMVLKWSSQIHPGSLKPHKVDKLLQQGSQAYTSKLHQQGIWMHSLTNMNTCSESQLSYPLKYYWITKSTYNREQGQSISDPIATLLPERCNWIDGARDAHPRHHQT